MTPRYIVDEFADIASKVSTKLLATLQTFDANITGVHYLHGHPIEIIETLAERDKSGTFRFKKYPLIALFQDFPEEMGQIGYNGEARLHLIIARATQATYKAPDRYTKNFKPVLYPVYLELMKQIHYSKAFQTISETQIRHTKIDRLYWGKEGLYANEGNVFNDKIDCIEIKDLRLLTNTKC